MWHLCLFLFQFYRLNRIKYRLSVFVPALPPHSFILRRTPIWHGGRKINDLCCTRFQQRFPLTFISYLEYCALLTHFHQHWFHSYLFGQQQHTYIANNYSSWCTTSAGIPHGEVSNFDLTEEQFNKRERLQIWSHLRILR